MLERDGYPAGVPCWVDIMEPDLDAAMSFYGDLFGWDFEVRTPPGAPQRYAYARLDGRIVAGIGGPPASEGDAAGWTNYIWVDSVDATVAAVEANGGRVVAPPVDIPKSGRVATCADPAGAVFGLWQARENRGVQLVNVPGSWNFSELHTADPAGAQRFYGEVFGWLSNLFEMSAGQKSWILRVLGYGDFLAERDPELRERQAASEAPDGFADAVALMSPDSIDGRPDAPPQWSVIFAVADADAAFARAIELGATEVTPLFDTQYTRTGAVADPQGAVLTLSEYRPPEAN